LEGPDTVDTDLPSLVRLSADQAVQSTSPDETTDSLKLDRH